MDKRRWNTGNISWYKHPNKRLGYLALAVQSLCMAAAFLQLVPGHAPCPAAIAHIASGGVAYAAGILDIIAAILIAVICLTSLKTCAAPMTSLYHWSYPNFEYSFVFTLVLLALAFFTGRQGSASSEAQCFGLFCFCGGVFGLFYAIHMFWTFSLSPDCRSKAAYSYVIAKLNDEQEQGLRLYDLWQRYLLEDCCKRLKDGSYLILETILNESLTKGYDELASLERQGKQASPEKVESTWISFLAEQMRNWNVILSEGSLEECGRLLMLDMRRLFHELEGEHFPKFQLRDRSDAGGQPRQEAHTEVKPGRIVWFAVLLQKSKKDGFGQLLEQMYAETVKECEAWGYTQQTADEVFHQLLMIGHMYYSIEKKMQVEADSQPRDMRLDLVQMWGRLSTPFSLTETRFDELLTLSARLYAASNGWSCFDYLKRTNQIETVGDEEKTTLFKYDLCIALIPEAL